MYQFLYTALETGCAALVVIPMLMAVNRFYFHNRKVTLLSILFTLYLCGVYAVVGLPNVTYIRFDLNLNLIPFSGMLPGLTGTLLNVILFIPLGIFLPILWDSFRKLSQTLSFGFFLSLAIELLQMFTLRATDINDLITNTIGTLLGFLLGKMVCRLFPGLPCHSRKADLPFLILLSTAVMFLLQPLFWKLIY